MELTKQLQTQLCGLREEHQAMLGRLKDAHSLLDKHVEASNRLQESEVYTMSCIRISCSKLIHLI